MDGVGESLKDSLLKQLKIAEIFLRGEGIVKVSSSLPPPPQNKN